MNTSTGFSSKDIEIIGAFTGMLLIVGLFSPKTAAGLGMVAVAALAIHALALNTPTVIHPAQPTGLIP